MRERGERVAVVPREARAAITPPASIRVWAERRIESELREYVVGGWPRDEEFTAAGRGPLLAQVNATGGPVRWARRIAVIKVSQGHSSWALRLGLQRPSVRGHDTSSQESATRTIFSESPS